MKKKVLIILTALALCISLVACDAAPIVASGTQENVNDTQRVTNRLSSAQKTPTDIDYSLERYNLIRRAYWVNGQRERANTLVCQVDKPLGYIVLFAGNAVVERFVVDGKVSSLNSFLSPDYIEESEWHSDGGTVTVNTQLADVDGSYGENDNGIFFFTPDGKYVEWKGEYLYSDIPFEIDAPVVRYQNDQK